MNYKLCNDTNIQIGQRMRKIRENLGYTRELFAELLDVSESTLSNIELGRTYVSQNVLLNLYNKFLSAEKIIILKKENDSEELII